jgi:cob(I)alamin adenosyltransferase
MSGGGPVRVKVLVRLRTKLSINGHAGERVAARFSRQEIKEAAHPVESIFTYLTGMSDVRRGLIIVNTGPGKGKTTAAMGTALRAVGQGMRVLMLQFLKGSWHYGELDAVHAFGDKFVMRQMGRGFVKVGTEKPDPEDVKMVEEAWAEADKAIHSGDWDLVVLDEINYAISYGMLNPATVVESLRTKPEMMHVILTGRNAHPTIVEIADTVTEMRQVKHAYEKGVMAQRGIEY